MHLAPCGLVGLLLAAWLLGSCGGSARPSGRPPDQAIPVGDGAPPPSGEPATAPPRAAAPPDAAARPAATAAGEPGIAQHRAFIVEIERADGLSAVESRWALEWMLPRLNARCAKPGPPVESHAVELEVDRRGKATLRSYSGPEPDCVRHALDEARFPIGRPAIVRASLSILTLEAGLGFSAGHGGSGSSSGITWKGPVRPDVADERLARCRRGERHRTYDVELTVARDGAVRNARAIEPADAAARCVVAAIAGSRTRPRGDEVTLRVLVSIGPPWKFGPPPRR